MAASRVGLGTASRRVAALAEQFSEDLLGEERAAFETIEVTYARGIVALRSDVQAALKAVAGDPARLTTRAALRRSVVNVHTRSLVEARVAVQNLADVAATSALDAIGAELLVCEQTMARRFAGITTEAVDRLRDRLPVLLTHQIDAFDLATADMGTGLADEHAVQYRAAGDEDALLKRLFSPDPAGLRGFGGRGIWWRACSDVKAAARTVAIGTANAVREATMSQFNVEHAARAGEE